MKKLFIILILNMSLGLMALPTNNFKITSAHESSAPKLAIVIDDFGEDRRGVEEMLSLPCKLTIAVMPGMDYSEEDANRAYALGHEVILHMPMENQSQMPASYYGPVLIKNSFSEREAVETLRKALNSVPHVAGMNIHMGTGVSRNKPLLKAMMAEARDRGLYFLDSKTIEGSACAEAAKETGVKFYERNFFLEPPGRPSYERAKSELLEAADYALAHGSAVAIGHVGPVGDKLTAKAILDTLETLKNKGIEVVALSQL